MKLYIAGPMTGIEDYNYPAFEQARRDLLIAGYDVESPAGELVDGWEWRDYMRRALQQLLTCDGVALLPYWATSWGAKIEYNLATELEMPRRNVAAWVARSQKQRTVVEWADNVQATRLDRTYEWRGLPSESQGIHPSPTATFQRRVRPTEGVSWDELIGDPVLGTGEQEACQHIGGPPCEHMETYKDDEGNPCEDIHFVTPSQYADLLRQAQTTLGDVNHVVAFDGEDISNFLVGGSMTFHLEEVNPEAVELLFGGPLPFREKVQGQAYAFDVVSPEEYDRIRSGDVNHWATFAQRVRQVARPETRPFGRCCPHPAVDPDDLQLDYEPVGGKVPVPQSVKDHGAARRAARHERSGRAATSL